jgi:hypothetical protein
MSLLQVHPPSTKSLSNNFTQEAVLLAKLLLPLPPPLWGGVEKEGGERREKREAQWVP